MTTPNSVKCINHAAIIAGENIPSSNLAVAVEQGSGKIVLADCNKNNRIIGFSLYPAGIGEKVLINTEVITFNKSKLTPGCTYFIKKQGSISVYGDLPLGEPKTPSKYITEVGQAVSDQVLVLNFIIHNPVFN